MRSVDFFETHPVFTHDEFLQARGHSGASAHTSNNLLAKHLASGRITRLRRGLYANVPRGVDPDQASADPYLVATKLAADGAVAYHAALQFHGKARTIWRRFHYLTPRRVRPFRSQDMEFAPVQAAVALRSLPDLGGEIVEGRHGGGIVRVTSLERTLVDVLSAPRKAGGWEEIWRSLEMTEFFDCDAIADYALKLGSALTVARVGFFLEQHREELMVEDRHLSRLREHAPAQPRYLDACRQSGRLLPQWNLVVPEWILDRAWES